MPVIIHRKDTGLVINYNKVAKKFFGIPAKGKNITVDRLRPQLLPSNLMAKTKEFTKYDSVIHHTLKGKKVSLTVFQKQVIWKRQHCFIDFLEQPIEGSDAIKIAAPDVREEERSFSTTRFSDVLFFGKMGKAELNLQTFLLELSVELLLLLDVETSQPRTIPLNDFLNTYVHPGFQTIITEKIAGAMNGVKSMEKVVDAEFAMITAKGRKIWIEAKGFFKDNTALGILHDVTERTAAGQKLQDAIKLFDRLSGNVPGMLFKFSITNEGMPYFHFASKGAYELFGATGEELEKNARLMLQHIHPEDLARQMPQLRQAFFAGAPWEDEFRVIQPNGSIKWVSVSAHSYQEEPSKNFWYGFMHDTTDRKNAERIIMESYTALEIERNKFHSLVSDIDGIVWEADAQTFKFSFVSQQAEKMLGYPVSDWLSDPSFWANKIHPEDRDRVVNYCVSCTKELRDHDFEYRMIRPDGSEVWMHDQVTVVHANGKPILLRGIMIDTTQRKFVQQRLLDSEIKNRLIIENSGEGILFSDANGKILSANPEACKILRMTEEEVCHAGREGLVDIHDPKFNYILKQRDEEGFFRGEISMKRKNGDLFSAEISSKLFVGSEGQLFGTTVFRDIEERKTMEFELTRIKNNLRAILDASTDAICFLDSQGKILEANSTARKVMCAVLKKELILGDKLVDLMPEKARDNFNNKFNRALQGEITEQETEQFMDGTSIGWYRSRFLPVKDEAGNILGVSFDVINITARKQAESALKGSEEKFRSIVNYSGEGILYTSPDGRIFSANPEACRIFEMSEAEICVAGRNGLIDKSDPTQRQAIADEEGFFQGELQMKRSSGEVFTAEITSKVFVDPRGELKATVIVRDITERKKIEKALRDREVLLQGVLDSTNDGILAVGSNGKVINYNNRLGQLWQMPKELIDSNDEDDKLISFVLDQLTDPEAFLLKVRELYNSDTTSFDLIHFKDGRIFERYSTPLLLSKTNVGRVWSFRDITYRLKAEQDLKESRDQFSNMIDNLPGYVYRLANDPDRTPIFISGQVEEVTGYHQDEYLVQRTISCGKEIHPEDARKISETIQEAIAFNQSYEGEYRIITKQNIEKWVMEKGKGVFDETGKLKHLEGFVTDITNRKHAEEKLKNSEAKLNAFFQSTTDAVILLDQNYEMLDFNHSAIYYAHQLMGIELKVGGNMSEVIPGPQWKLFSYNVQQAFSGETILKEVEAQYPSGKRVWWYVQYIPIRTQSGIIGVAFNCTDIDEKKRANDRIKALADNIPDGLIFEFWTSADGKDYKFIYMSQGCKQLHELNPEDVLKNPDLLFSQIIAEDLPAMMEASRMSRESLTDYEFDQRINLPSGKKKWIKVKSKPRRLEDGSVLFEGISLDITAQKVSAQLLEKSENDLRAMLNATTDNIVFVDVNGLIRVANNYAAKSFKKSFNRELEINELFINIIPESQRPEMLLQIKRALSGEAFDFEREYDQFGWRQIRYLPVRNDQSQIIGVSINTINITERKLAEQSLKQSEERFRIIYNQTPVMMHSIDSEGKLVGVNDYWLEKMEYAREEVLGKQSIDFLTTESFKKAVQEVLPQFYSEGKVTNVEYKFVTKSGKILDTFLSAIAEYDSQGRITKSMAVITDITEKKKLQKEVEKLAMIASHTSNVVVLTDVNGCITWVNEGFEKVTGYTRAEVTGQKPGNILQGPETDSRTIQVMRDALRKGNGFKVEILNYSKTGKKYWLDIEVMPILDEHKKLTGFMAIESDITQLKMAVEEMLNSQTRLQTMMDNAPMVVFLKDIQKRYIFFNKMYENVFDKVKSKSVKSNQDDIFEQNDEEILRSNGSISFEEEFGDRQFYTTKFPISDYHGNIYGLGGISLDITERKAAEEQFRSLVRDVSIGVLLQGPNAEVLLSNQAALDLLGLTEDQLHGRSSFSHDWNVIHEDGTDFPATDHPVPQSILNKKPVRGVVMGLFRPVKNDRVWLLLDAIPRLNSNGEVINVICTFNDITPIKAAQEIAEESRSRLRVIADGLPSVAIFQYEISPNDEVGHYKYFSSGVERITGITPKKMIEDPQLFETQIHPKDVQLMQARFLEAIENFSVFDHEYRFKHLDNGWRWLRTRSQPSRMSNGRVVWNGLVIDITEQKEAQRKLKRSETRLRAIINNEPNCIKVINIKGELIEMNASGLKMIEADNFKSVQGQSVIGMIDEPFRKSFIELTRSVIQGGTGTLEFSITGLKGAKRWLETSAVPLKKRKGKRNLLLGITRDITEHKAAEAELIKSQSEYQRLIQMIPVGVFKNGKLPNGKSKMLYVSPRWCNLNGVEYEEVMQNFSIALNSIHPEDLPTFLERGNTALQNETDFSWEGRRIVKDSVRYIHIESSPEKLENGEVIWNGIEYDITERKNAELGLLKTLAEKESLIKEIHHRVKNNLQLISSVIYIRMKGMKQSVIKDFLEDTRQKIRSIALIHERLLQTGAVNEVDISDYLGKLIADMQMTCTRSDLHISIDSEIEPEKINLDVAINCGLILNELVTNSIKHAFVNSAAGRIDISFHKNGKGYELIVQDDGASLPETVSIGQTGSFGMQMLDIFIKQLGGTAEINREGGTRFLIRF